MKDENQQIILTHLGVVLISQSDVQQNPAAGPELQETGTGPLSKLHSFS